MSEPMIVTYSDGVGVAEYSDDLIKLFPEKIVTTRRFRHVEPHPEGGWGVFNGCVCEHRAHTKGDCIAWEREQLALYISNGGV